jgi:hypothetical protein
LIIHYEYLWRREAAAGRDNARYPRPCAIILARRQAADGSTVVVVAPVTHSRPSGETTAVEVPVAIKRELGLDADQSWIIVDEVNEFVWPGHDLAVNGRGEFAYGVIPDRLHQRIKAGVMASAAQGRLRIVPR